MKQIQIKVRKSHKGCGVMPFWNIAAGFPLLNFLKREKIQEVIKKNEYQVETRERVNALEFTAYLLEEVKQLKKGKRAHLVPIFPTY